MTNFAMDYIVLYIVNRICRFAATKLRIMLAAAIGALWSVVAIILPEIAHGIVIICTYVLISFFMIKMCAVGFKLREVLKGVIVLYGVTFVLAGAIHMLVYNTYAGYYLKEVLLKDEDLFLFIIVSLILLYLIGIQFFKIKTYGCGICRVVIRVCNQTIELRGFVDTGNVLVDPCYKRPVCVAYKPFFSAVLCEIDYLPQCKYHIIPFSSLGCERGLLEVITVDNMYIYHNEKKYELENVLVGLSETKLSGDEEFDMLINAEVMK